MSKKILSIVLTLVLALGTFIPVSANESSAKVTQVVDCIANMSENGRIGIINSVNAFQQAGDKEKLSNVFSDAIKALAPNQQERIEKEFDIDDISILIQHLAEFASVIEKEDADNFSKYLSGKEMSKTQKQNLIDALEYREFDKKLEEENIDLNNLPHNISKADDIFNKLFINNTSHGYKILTLKNNVMSINDTEIDLLFDALNGLGQGKIDDRDSIKKAGEVLANHYYDCYKNRQAMLNFLKAYGLVYVDKEPGHSGGGSSSSGGGGGASLPTGNVKEIVKDVEKVKSEGSAYKVVSNVKYAMEKLAKDAGKLSKQAEVVSNTKALLESINKVGDMINSRSYAQQSLTNITATIETVNDVIKELDNDEDVNGIIIELKGTVNVTAGLMANADNMYKAKDTASKLIKSVGALNKMNKGDKRVLGQINEELVNVANVAITNASVCKISGSHVKVTNGQASATINTQQLEKSINEMNKVRDELRSTFLKQNIKISTPVVKSISVNVAEINGVKEVKAVLPSLTDVMNKVDNVQVNTQNAVFNINKDTFTPAQLAKELTLTANEVEEVSEQLKKQMPEDTVVVELNVAVDNKKVNEFTKPIEVTIPYTLGEKEDPMKIAVFNAKVDNTIEVVGGRYNKALESVTFTTNHFSKYFAKENKKSFTDIRNNSNKAYIEALASKGYINGKMDTRFAPNDNITRAEFVTLITQMFKLEGNVNKLQFTDVAKDAWYAPYVAAAVQEGYVSGRTNTTFAPDDLITNQEMVALVVNILKTNGYSNVETNLLEKFDDNDEVSNWAVAPMKLAYYLGIIDGEANDTLQPKTPATRADAAALMYKLFALN